MTTLQNEQMFLYEKVDVKALRIIRDNFDALYDTGKLGRFVDAKNGYSVIQDKKIVYDMINDFYKTRLKGEKQKYKYANGIKWGRMFSDGVSLQGISRVIRQTISKDIYWDIDIVNAHPVILYKYCQTHKLQVPVLQRYIEKRDELLKDLMSYQFTGDSKGMSRDEAKAIPLAIINGGLRNNWFSKGEAPDWILLLEREVKDIYNHFRGTDKGRKFHRRAVSKKDKNVEGSTLNYFLCEQENEILCCMYSYLQQAGMKVGVFCFDGMMVYKKFDEDSGKVIPFADKLLRGMEGCVSETLGYDLKISVKEMTEFTSLDGLNKFEDIDASDEACATHIYEKLDILYHGLRKELYIYDEKLKLWVLRDRECLRNVMTPILSNYFSADKDKEQMEKNMNEMMTSRKQSSILIRLWAMILGEPKDSLIEEKLDKARGLFPISDGRVVVLQTGEVRERVKSDYFTRDTKREFLLEPDEKFVREYLAEVLTTRNSSYVDLALYIIGYCLTGENNMKQFYILLGEKDTGKSLFLEILGRIFESWGGAVNDKVFKQSRSESVHNTEAFELIQKRVAFVSELEEKERFNEQLMKKISGGDSMNIRACGSDKNVTVKFNSVLMLALNEVPKFNESAFAGRMRVLDFKTKFQNNPERREAILGKIDDFFSVACQYAQKYYEKGLKFDDVEEVLQSTRAVVDERDTFKTWLEEDNYTIDKTKDEPSWRIKKTSVFANYMSWCECNKVDGLGRTKFYVRFQEEYKLSEYAKVYWCGIKERGFGDV